MKKIALLLIVITGAYADGWIVCGQRADGAVGPTSENPNSNTAYLGAPRSPIVTWVPIAKSSWNLPSLPDPGDGVPLYSINGGKVIARPNAAVIAERAANVKAAAYPKLVLAQQQLSAAQAIQKQNPNDAGAQSQVTAAASLVTIYASQAGVAVTTK